MDYTTIVICVDRAANYWKVVSLLTSFVMIPYHTRGPNKQPPLTVNDCVDQSARVADHRRPILQNKLRMQYSVGFKLSRECILMLDRTGIA